MKWVKPRLVTIVGYNKDNKEVEKRVVMPFQYKEERAEMEKNEEIVNIEVTENYRTYQR